MFFLLKCCCTQVGFQEVGSIEAHFSATNKNIAAKVQMALQRKYCQYSTNDQCIQYQYYKTMNSIAVF